MVLVIAEHDSASLMSATLHAVTAASELVLLGSGEVHLLVAGQQAADAAIAATKVSGVARVIYAEGEFLAHGFIDNIAAQVLAIARHCSHILLPATAWGETVAARVASTLSVAPVCDVIGILSLDAFERLHDAGHEIATVESRAAVKVLTVRTNGFDAAGQGGTAAIEGVKPIADSGNRVFVNSTELTSAKLSSSGIRALGYAEQFNKFMPPPLVKLSTALYTGFASERPAHGSERQDRGAAALHSRRNFWSEPTPSRDEGLPVDRGDQRERRGTYLLGSGLRHGSRHVHGGAGVTRQALKQVHYENL